MTGSRGTSRKRKGRDKVLQFAPNFTVYVQPPDVVCLYSEDRKFFLHGELYCALASAVGDGGRNVRPLLRELSRSFPSIKIREALHRLVARGFMVEAAAIRADAVAAYWASLGLPPGTAEKNLEKCRVRIRSLGVDGADELHAALARLGVRFGKRAPGLTITLVSDYLDGRLAEQNKEHLSDRTRWLLAQPSGIFPLVGPVFHPGKGPCWACLAERMKRNREVKAYFESAPARRVAVSPLAEGMLGRSGVELAAIEIAKAIATRFGTELRDHIISLDLSGATSVKHYVAARPQCPACGRRQLRDPHRIPMPVKLGRGSKVVSTSGGYRTVSPRATLARFQKHVSPLTGVVSRLERIETDLPLNATYYARHNFSAPAETIHELRAAIGSVSFGKGSTAEQGEASALMEAIERYCGIFRGDEIRVTRRLVDFAAGEAIAPNMVLLFSDTQYRLGRAAAPGSAVPAPFDHSAEIEWSPLWSLRDRRFKYLPTSLLYFFYRGAAATHADSNGCAAGNTLEEAIVQGFLELVERDAYAIWWYNRLRRSQVDLDRSADPYCRDLQNQFAETGRRLWVLDVGSDLGIPSFVAIAHWMENGRQHIEFGSGAHFDARIAVLRALTELNQFLSLGVVGVRKADQSSLDGSTPLRLRDHPFLQPNGKAASALDFRSTFGQLDTREQVARCVRIAKTAGLDFLVLDQTRPDIGVPVVRVIVPGIRHFYRRLAPGRLYDVPVKLGLRDRPLAEHELNPFHPHT